MNETELTKMESKILQTFALHFPFDQHEIEKVYILFRRSFDATLICLQGASVKKLDCVDFARTILEIDATVDEIKPTTH